MFSLNGGDFLRHKVCLLFINVLENESGGGALAEP